MINDGVTDAESLRVLKKKAPNIPTCALSRKKTKGLSAVRNRACAEAKGEYLTYLDADDKIEPSYYSRRIALLEQYPNVGYCGKPGCNALATMRTLCHILAAVCQRLCYTTAKRLFACRAALYMPLLAKTTLR